jgi:hypothetical protein
MRVYIPVTGWRLTRWLVDLVTLLDAAETRNCAVNRE